MFVRTAVFLLAASAGLRADRIHQIGQLSEPSAALAHVIARAFVDRDSTKLSARVSASGFEHYEIARAKDQAGWTHFVFERRRDGVKLFDGDVQIAVDSAGRVRRFTAVETAAAFDSGHSGSSLSETDAIERAMRFAFAGAGRDAEVDRAAVVATPVWFAVLETNRRCWQVYVPSEGGRLLVIGADDGEILFDRVLAHTAEGRVFEAPGTPHPNAGSRSVETFSDCPTDIYPSSVRADCWVSGTQTSGNNIDACVDADSNNLCDRRASAGNGNFDFPFSDSYKLTTNPAPDADAVLTNAFYWTNVAHDWLYRLGFDESAGNFQSNNFGRGGSGGDAVRVDIHENSGSLARIVVPPDGIAARLDLGLNAGARRDSALDADIILHEYVHGMTARMIGSPNSVTGLFLWQSGALNEGWSDAYAASFTNDPVIAEYTTNHSLSGIRTVSYGNSPYTYGHFGTLRLVSPVSGVIWPASQVHRDGEIWASVLWELRQAIGRTAFEQVVTTALNLTPSRPDMLEARDAIIAAADALSVGGPNQCTVWNAFAARGFGFSAAVNPIEAGQPNDTALSVYESFDAPSICGGNPPILQTVLGEGAETASGWVATGLWHPSARRASAGSSSWWFGQQSSGNYNTGGRVTGTLTSPAINLNQAGDAQLEWQQLFAGQGFGSNTLGSDPLNGYLNRDSGRLLITTNGGATWQTLSTLSHNSASFVRHRVNLRRFVGNSVQLRFEFDTFDGIDNAHEGWYVDEIEVLADQAVVDELTLSEGTLDLSAPAGGSAGPRSLGLSTEGNPALAWSAVASAGWLTVFPSSGTGDATLTIGANAASLNAGTHQATVEISAGSANRSLAVTFVVVPPALPVAQWRFEEFGGGPGVTLTDSISGVHSATTEGVGTAAMLGASGWARLFDGVSSYAQAAPSLDYAPQQFTIRTWVRLQRYPDSLGVVLSAFGGSNFKGWALGVDAAGRVFFLAATPPSSSPWLLSGSSLELHRWHMLTATFDRSSGDAFLYIDDTEVGSATFPGLEPDLSTPLTIGKAGWADTYYLNAGIDETLLEPKILTAAEITADFHSFQPRGASSSDELSAQWNWESSGADQSGNGHGFSLTGGTSLPGVNGNAIAFDGRSGFGVGFTSERLSSASFTVETWIKLLSVPSQWGVVVSNYDGDFSGWYLGVLPDGRAFVAVGRRPSSLPSVTTQPLAVGRWHHLAASYDGPRQEMKIYLDGALQQQAFTGGFTPRPNGDLTVGRASWGPWHHLNAAIDETRVLPRVESAGEIAADFGAFSPPSGTRTIASWEFADTTTGPGAVLADASGNGHSAIVQGNRNKPRGGIDGPAREFGGYPDYARVPAHADFGAPVFTFSTWLRVEQLPEKFGVIFSTFSGGFSGWFAAVNNDGRVIFAVTGPNSQPWLMTTEAMEVGRWYHLAFSFEGISRRGVVYIDGQRASSAVFPAFAAESATDPTFGRASWVDSYHLKCTLDAAKLVDAELSESVIAAEHAVLSHLQDPAPLASWNFDDAGPVFADSTTAGHDADSAGGTQLVAGLSGSARRFDGIADSAVVNPHADFATESFTFAAVVKLEQLPSGWGVVFSTFGGDARGWWIGVNSDGRLIFNVSGLPNSTPWLLSDTVLNPGLWHHVAVSFDAVSRRGAIYIDAQLDQTAVFPVFTPRPGVAPTFGSGSWGETAYLGFDLDAAALWSVELSLQQIAGLAGGQ